MQGRIGDTACYPSITDISTPDVKSSAQCAQSKEFESGFRFNPAPEQDCLDSESHWGDLLYSSDVPQASD